MTLGGNSVETVAIAFDFVAEREGADPDIFGLVDELWGVTFYRMEDDIVVHPFAEEGFIELQNGAEGLGTINVEIACTAVHCHRAEQAEEAEEVVSVDMGDENGFDFQERHVGTPELLLSALTAIDKKQAPVH